MHLSDGQNSAFYLSETTKSFFCSKIKMLMTRTEWVFAFCGKIIDDSVQYMYMRCLYLLSARHIKIVYSRFVIF